jgi:hypothetical protein
VSGSLAAELQELEQFWTAPFQSNRHGNAVNTVTYGKRRERIRCFFGFLVLYRCCLREQLSLSLFKHWQLMESFTHYYLQDVRQLTSASVAEFLTAAIFACKWLFRDDQLEKSNMLVIRRSYFNPSKLARPIDCKFDTNRWISYCKERNRLPEIEQASPPFTPLSFKYGSLQYTVYVMRPHSRHRQASIRPFEQIKKRTNQTSPPTLLREAKSYT